MKNIVYFTILIGLLIGTNGAYAQPWNNLLPKEKVENNTVNFFDYQKAFSDYWAPKNVVNGYYIVSGTETKAGGWKQFKRWEWYWENRVNPTTGAFPSTSAYYEYSKIAKSATNLKSPAGNWTNMGPSVSTGGYAGLGRINRIGFHPTDNNTYYAGSAGGGLWKTTDNGSSWIAQGDSFGAMGVSDIVVLTTASDDIVFVATGDKDHSDSYSVGVLKSTDGGTTWMSTGLTFTVDQNQLINRLLVDPTSNNIFYAATSAGLYKSTDSCNTWTLISGIEFIDMEFKPGAPNILYGSTWQGEVYKSTNSGGNWTTPLSTSGSRTELAVSENDATIVYALVSNSNSGLFGVYKSTDSGSSFSPVYTGINLLAWSCSGGDSGGQAWYDLCIAADPTNENIVYLGGVNTWKSTDGGVTWNINNHWSSTCGGGAVNVHADKHDLAFQNGTSTLFECNDGGLYSTADGGSSWAHLTNGMSISQMYKLGVSQTTTQDVITGLQDNGTKALLTSTWTDVIGGDGMECLIDYTNENTQYGSLYYGSIYRTTDHWANSVDISGGLSGNAAWVTPYVQDPNAGNTLFVGYQDVWKSTNQGTNWTKISTLAGNTLRSLAVAPSNSNYIYTATTGDIYTTSNGGSNWSNITGSLPVWASNITYISVKNDDPATLWVSMGSFNNYGVFESTNGGSSWTDISTGLPMLPINCVIQNKQNSTDVELYAATDIGVYVKIGSADWIPFFNDMPNVVVTELDIYYDNATPSNSLIRASTFGRGLWESDLYSAVTPPPTADFVGVPTSGIAPLTVAFTDLSVDSVNLWDWNFGDGATSTNQNPSHEYTNPGTYSVTLIVSGPGGSDTLEKVDYILANYNPPVADFSGTPTSGTVPLTVVFTDQSVDTVNTWNWDFGDGSVSTDQNPSHDYIDPGTYSVTLIVSGPGGSDTLEKVDYISADYNPPIADFTGNPTGGIVPLSVAFTDQSVDSVNTWSWDFGDGENSTIQNPNHIYQSTGDFTVKLVVSGPGGSDSITKTDYITVNNGGPIADFVGSPTSGIAPMTVLFTDLSIDSVNTWQWYFGDGGTSSAQNPSYEYVDAGTYDVKLVVSGPGGSDSLTKANYIFVSQEPAPVAEFIGNPTTGVAPLLVNFDDLSTGSITDWDWDFGDGDSSTEQNPTHIYVEPNNYTVSLTVTGLGGSNTMVKTDYILIPVGMDETTGDEILAYPNPVSNNVNIVFKHSKKRRLVIKNMSGNTVLETVTNNTKEILHMDNLTSGVYTLLIICDNETVNTLMLVKE